MHRRGLVATAAMAVAVLFLTGACGSSEYRFVSDSDTNTYLKVPKSWTEYGADTLLTAQAATGGVDLINPLDRASLLGEKLIDEGAIRRRVQWRLAFDSDSRPSLQHVIFPGNEAPVVEVLVRDLTEPPELRELVSASILEDLFERQVGMAQGLSQTDLESLAAEGSAMPMEIKAREVSFEDGMRKMRLIAGFRGVDDEVYTLDQTALIDADTQHLYILVIRARENEYITHYDVLDEIAKSFTVKQNG